MRTIRTIRWSVRYPLGTVDSMRATGTVAAPLLAGFGFATLTLLATADLRLRWGDLAITAFALGAALFVFSLQFTATGLLYSASPGERLGWLPPGTPEEETVERATLVQHRDAALQQRYFLRARLTYDLGMLSHLVGLAAIVLPADLLSLRGVAFAIVTIALILEAVWIAAAWSGRRPQWLLPSYAHLKPPPH